MDNNSSFDYKDRKYDIVAYDPNWLKMFSAESEIIKKVFKSDIEIEHIGSTSVPGMEGKPCIDILAIINDIDKVKNYLTEIEKSGYIYRGNVVSKDALLFTKMEDGATVVNLHFIQEHHPHIFEMLSLRNYLRNNPIEVTKYSALKRELYQKHGNNYAEYRKIKDEYMEKLKDRVKKFLE
jgi:GrpB-like predicted nucleotidyltransferase (UPF0157 family)